MWIIILSDYKSVEQIEFAELFEKLKAHDINAIDVALELQTTPQAVSMWKQGKRNPRPLALEKLRAMVARVCGEPVPVTGQLKDAPTENDAAIWRRRAKTAETELANLKATLRQLGSNSKVSEQVDAIEDEEAQKILRARPSPAPHKP